MLYIMPECFLGFFSDASRYFYRDFLLHSSKNFYQYLPRNFSCESSSESSRDFFKYSCGESCWGVLFRIQSWFLSGVPTHAIQWFFLTHFVIYPTILTNNSIRGCFRKFCRDSTRGSSRDPFSDFFPDCQRLLQAFLQKFLHEFLQEFLLGLFLGLLPVFFLGFLQESVRICLAWNFSSGFFKFLLVFLKGFFFGVLKKFFCLCLEAFHTEADTSLFLRISFRRTFRDCTRRFCKDSSRNPFSNFFLYSQRDFLGILRVSQPYPSRGFFDDPSQDCLGFPPEISLRITSEIHSGFAAGIPSEISPNIFPELIMGFFADCLQNFS